MKMENLKFTKKNIKEKVNKRSFLGILVFSIALLLCVGCSKSGAPHAPMNL